MRSQNQNSHTASSWLVSLCRHAVILVLGPRLAQVCLHNAALCYIDISKTVVLLLTAKCSDELDVINSLQVTQEEEVNYKIVHKLEKDCISVKRKNTRERPLT